MDHDRGAAGRSGEGTEIEFLLTADHAEAVNGKLYMMGGGWDRRGVMDFKQPQGFAVVIGVSVPWNDTNRPIPLRMALLDADGGEVMPPFQTQLTIGRPPNAQPGQRLRVMMSLNLMAMLPRAGQYVIDATVDDVATRRITFYADQVQPPTR